MDEMEIFKFKEAQVRVVVQNGEPWFVAKDICDTLGLSNNRMSLERIDNDEKGVSLIDTLGGTQELQTVNEYGLYSLVLGSRKPEAKEFKRWITHEVIPSIRKHGAYMTPKKLAESLLNPDTMIQLLTTLKDEQEKNKELSVILEEQKPKVIFANSVESSKTTILVGELAKILKQNGVSIGQNRLFAWLRDNGYLISRKGSDYNMPTQYSMERGLFEIKESATNHEDGHTTINKVTKVSGRGQIYFANKFLSEVAV